MSYPDISYWPRSITTLWLVLISCSIEVRELSWPGITMIGKL